jgi:hypothetical protein
MALPLVPLFGGVVGIISWTFAKAVKDSALKIILTSWVSLIVIFYVSFVYLLYKISRFAYDKIIDLLHMLSSPSSGIVSDSYAFMSCSGVIDGINSSSFIVLSAVSFRLLWFISSVAIKFFISVYHMFQSALTSRLFG